MGLLRRLFGGQDKPRAAIPTEDPGAIEAEERSRELELLRDEGARLDDLAHRQLRYGDYAWQPPAQGGERRADDSDATDSGADTT